MYTQCARTQPSRLFVEILKPKIVNPSNEVASHQLLNKTIICLTFPEIGRPLHQHLLRILSLQVVIIPRLNCKRTAAIPRRMKQHPTHIYSQPVKTYL